MVVKVIFSETDSKDIQKRIDFVGNTPSHLHFNAGEYDVNSLIRFYSNTKITCDPKTVFTLMENAPTKIFNVQVPVFGQKGNSITGLDFSGVNFKGNYKNQNKTSKDHGEGYHNCFGFTRISDSIFHDMNVGENEGDEFRITTGNNLKFYNIKSAFGGHDCFHLNSCKDVDIFECDIKTRANNAVRIREDCSNVSIYNNVFDGSISDTYAPAIQGEILGEGHSLTNLRIYGNYIHDMFGSAGWFYVGANSGKTSGISITNNFIRECGKMPEENQISGVGGFTIDGFDDILFEGNAISGCLGYGILFGRYLSHCPLNNLHAKVRENLIICTKESNFKGEGSGSAIANLSGKYNVDLGKNFLSYNVNNYYGFPEESTEF